MRSCVEQNVVGPADHALVVVIFEALDLLLIQTNIVPLGRQEDWI